VAFIDDNKIKQNRIVHGLHVYSYDQIEDVVKRKKVDRILVAMPTVPMADKEKVVQKLKHLPCKIQIMPSHVDIIQGKSVLDTFVPVAPEDLLGRHQLDFSMEALNAPYENKSILISGAGGSIGLELCRQILKHSPAKIVLFERSEFALYKAERDLRAYAEQIGVDLVPALGSVCDAKTLKHVFDLHKIQVVFHAAAYKHVPLVECNEVSALWRQTLRPLFLCLQTKPFVPQILWAPVNALQNWPFKILINVVRVRNFPWYDLATCSAHQAL